MFIGSFTHTLDTAGRFVMPKSFRYSLGERFYITKGMGCLNVLTEDQMRAFAQKLESRGDITESVYNSDLSLLQHHFFSGLTEAKIDGQNRLTIPQELKTYADIRSAVTVNGKAPFKMMELGVKYGKRVIGITGILGDGYKACLDAGFYKIVPLLNPTMDTTKAIESVIETTRTLFENYLTED